MKNGPQGFLSPANAQKLKALHELASEYLRDVNDPAKSATALLSPKPVIHIHNASRPGIGVQNALCLTKDSWKCDLNKTKTAT